MKTSPHYSEPVANTLKQFPDLLTVFIRYRVRCFGCPMASFCTLQSAVEIHKLEGTEFLNEVENIIYGNPENSGAGGSEDNE